MKHARNFLVSLPFFLLALTAPVVAIAQGNLSGTVYQTSNVRSGPDTRFEIVEQLSDNARVQIDGRDDDSRWLHVLLLDGKSGWLPTFALIVDGNVNNIPLFDEQATPEAQATSGVNVISYGRVNVRSGPGIDYDITSQLDVNTQEQAIARSNSSNDWLMIRVGTGTGWVAYFTVNVQGDPTTLPILVPDSSGASLIPPSNLLSARFNVRLRQQPDLTSTVLGIVPFGSEVTPIGRSADSEWLFVGFKDASGWGSTQLFDIAADDLRALPIYGQGVETETPTPEATVES